VRSHPDVAPAARFFTEQYGEWKEEMRVRGAIPSPVRWPSSAWTHHPGHVRRAEARIDWQRVLDRRQAVLLDFRREFDLERRRFKTLWAFNYLMDFIKHRGLAAICP